MSTWPTGLLTALVTPLRDDALDLDGLSRLIEHQIDAGTVGLVVGGGTGEYGTLSVTERKLLAEESVSLTAGRIPVVVQTGTLSTRDAVELSVHAQKAGADALLVASPFGETISWRERVHFYDVLTREVAIPVMVYNTPPSGLLTFDQIRELAELPQISAVKDSSGSPELMGDLIAWAPPGFGVYIGLDSLLYDAVAAGATGAVFGTANLIPGPLAAIVTSLREHGPTRESRELWTGHVRPFLRLLEQSPNYVAACKAGLAHLGLPAGQAREPSLMPDQDEVDAIAQGLDAVIAAYVASPVSTRGASVSS